ncbi:hypothetical protein [Litoribrevibacter albus]|uniref:Uncharacterized protein n=1 Tax=Litoribrevibacter albus TaxID=1473156 RepID=A0AA37SAV3_9GAMM|nr:hypothetical protein [Litoribrevibacter albus]GLQ31038.1 hypothetical protein GCM10007876_15170 [Litoribrevibacter albus]
MNRTYKLIAEQGLPKFFLDGAQKYPFDAEKIFQDFYMLGKETREFKGRDASDLTNKALAIISSHKQQDAVGRSDVHNIITDLLYMCGYAKAAIFVKQRQQLQS